MQNRSAKELREMFLQYFEEKGCKRYHSFSLIPDDPTLLFTVAGMVPFKPYFLGIKKPEVLRATTAQKCVRTNDIENVGRTARHHTFFEMLGNFSFGDYFKEEIIPWSWEFMTERIGLEPERLYATIYLDDDEAHDIWRDKVGLPEERIIRLGDEDNFWAAGPTGPCGPCSEIIYDQGPEYSCGKPDCAVGCDCDRYLEIWNLVFMQFNRDEAGNLTPLPKKNIDTGMGLERLASVVQNVPTDFETDLFLPIIEEISKIANVTYGSDPKKDLAIKVIADHIRASAFMIADGILPTNEGRGYVLRRLIRRSIRYGRLLGIERMFMASLLPVVQTAMGVEYHELEEQSSAIEQVLNTEEDRFSRTLVQGSELLDTEVKKLVSDGVKVLPGEVAFVLYDTYGFPYELTEEICDEHGFTIDKDAFETEMEAQRERARASSKQASAVMAKSAYSDIREKSGTTNFVGYTMTEIETQVVAIIVDGEERDLLNEGESGDVILADTPFYAEKGGQVGDTGSIAQERVIFDVKDTVAPVDDLTAHRGTLLKGTLTKGALVKASIDAERRKAIQRHHTATHLIHEALTRVLGKHVRQAGSIVTPTFLRFDFNHFAQLTSEQIHDVEKLVFEQILKDLPVLTEEMSIEDAKKTGARALFDEKYGDLVRVLCVEGFSTELCGGTHVKRTGEIGVIKIVREEGIGSGIRRINAIVGQTAFDIFQRMGFAVAHLVTIFGDDMENITSRVEELMDEKKVLERKNRELQVKSATTNIQDSVKPAASVNGIDFIVEKFQNISIELIRQIGDKIRQKYPTSVILLIGVGEEKRVNMTVMASDEAVAKGMNAGTLMKEITAVMGGKGGGKPALAQGGAANDEKLGEAMQKAPAIFENLMNAKG
ncbi:alanine--tRNA ligase [Synergistaceae bacterium OttesenSCG-928-D05]|nr:alanine--tRNA ligase [Synergistaceae bacterium OttesenSCG-928-D05]